MSGQRSCTVFIGNIPYDASEEDLKEVFGKVGAIESLRLVYDKETKQPKGYAFCDYKDSDTALSAIRNLSDVECNGRRLRIDLADNALRVREAAGRAPLGPPLALALPAPERSRPGPGGPSMPSSIPPAPSAGPSPVGPPLPSGVAPMRPPGPQGPGGPGGPLAPGVAGGGPSPEAVMAAVSAHTEIAQTIAAMPQAQLQLCLGAMQRLATEAPEGSRAFLQDNPQLCYALLHAQLLLGLTLDPRLPAADDEVQQLRAEASRRPTLLAAVPPAMVGGVVVPPGFQGFPRPAIIGPQIGMPGYGMRPAFARPHFLAQGPYGAPLQRQFGGRPPMGGYMDAGLAPKGAPTNLPPGLVGGVPLSIA